jgi:hypothetical protein
MIVLQRTEADVERTGHKVSDNRTVKTDSCARSAIPSQREFANRVITLEKLKSAQCTALAELDTLFGTIQCHAFCGEL